MQEAFRRYFIGHVMLYGNFIAVIRLFIQRFVPATTEGNTKNSLFLAFCEGNTPTDGFPSQEASNAERVSIAWRHHVLDYQLTWYALGHDLKKLGHTGRLLCPWIQSSSLRHAMPYTRCGVSFTGTKWSSFLLTYIRQNQQFNLWHR